MDFVVVNKGGRRPGLYPPHPEEGASARVFCTRKHSVAPVSKDGAAPWFETPRTRPRNLAKLKLAAPHHEAGRDHGHIRLFCSKQIQALS